MRTYRIKIETAKNWKHIKQITIDSDDIEEVIERIKNIVVSEKEVAEQRFILKLSRNKGFRDDCIKNSENDLIDWNSKGKDISKEEWIKNEMEVWKD